MLFIFFFVLAMVLVFGFLHHQKVKVEDVKRHGVTVSRLKHGVKYETEAPMSSLEFKLLPVSKLFSSLGLEKAIPLKDAFLDEHLTLVTDNAAVRRWISKDDDLKKCIKALYLLEPQAQVNCERGQLSWTIANKMSYKAVSQDREPRQKLLWDLSEQFKMSQGSAPNDLKDPGRIKSLTLQGLSAIFILPFILSIFQGPGNAFNPSSFHTPFQGGFIGLAVILWLLFMFSIFMLSRHSTHARQVLIHAGFASLFLCGASSSVNARLLSHPTATLIRTPVEVSQLREYKSGKNTSYYVNLNRPLIIDSAACTQLKLSRADYLLMRENPTLTHYLIEHGRGLSGDDLIYNITPNP